MALGDEGPTKGNFKIVTNTQADDAQTRRRIMEVNVEKSFYIMLCIGSVMIFIALLW